MASAQQGIWASMRARFGCALLLLAALLGTAPDAAAQTGTVNGRVTNAATGAGVNAVPVFFCAGSTCVSQTTNANGNYTAVLAVGTYVAYTAAPAPLVDEVYDDIPCPIQPGCSTSAANTLGARIVVTAGSVANGVNFALSPGATITGRVTDAVTGTPLNGVQVQLRTRFAGGVATSAVTTAATGVFTFTGLGPGTYAAFTHDPATVNAHTDMTFRDLQCLGSCNETTVLDSGAPIVVAPAATVAGIDFALPPGGTIAGRVVNNSTGTGLSGVRVAVLTRAGVGLTAVSSASTDSTGHYAVTGLLPSAYLVTADATSSGAVSAVYDNRPCVATCTSAEIGAGTPVTVTAGATTTSDFRLAQGGSISGTLLHAITHAGVQGTVQVFRLEGTRARLAATGDAVGGNFVVSGLTTGVYVVLAQKSGFIRALYGGVSCELCPSEQLALGTPITVTSGAVTLGIVIELAPAGAISGTLRAAATNTPIAGAEVKVFRGGVLVGRGVTNTAGAYTTSELLAGGVTLATAAPGFANQVSGGGLCPNDTCVGNEPGAVKLGVVAATTFTGADFNLGPALGPPGAPQNLRASAVAGGVQFAWDAPAGPSPAGYVLEAGLSPATAFAAVPVAGTTFIAPGVPPGTFFLRVRARNAAGSSTASPELRLRVGNGGVILPGPPINFESMVVGGRLTMTWSPPETGSAPTNYLLEVGSASGAANIAVLPVGTTSFVFSGVPPGFYYFRVRAQNAGGTSDPGEEQMLVAGNAPAPPSVVPTISSTVAGNVLTLTWQAPAFGPVTSYRVEAGTALGLANLGVLDTGTTATSLVVPGVPPGTYYLRVRAANGQGFSTVSDERVIVVP